MQDLLEGLDVRVLAGAAGLDAPVRRVHVSELNDPTPWLTGGELLLTTGSRLDSEHTEREFIERLFRRRLVGLGLEAGRVAAEKPSALVGAAADRGFLLFEMPREVPFTVVTDAALTRIAIDDPDLFLQALDAQEKLERIALSEAGLEGLASALAELLRADILVMGGDGRILAEVGPPLHATVLGSTRSQIRAQAGREAPSGLTLNFEARGLAGLALPVISHVSAGNGDSPERDATAWLVAFKRDGPLSDLHRLTLQRAVTIVALELRRRHAAETAQRRASAEVVEAIARGELTGIRLRARLETLGLGQFVAAVAAGASEPNGSSMPAALDRALRRACPQVLVGSISGLTCAVITALPDHELFDLAADAGGRLESELRQSVFLGAGRAVPGEDALHAMEEAVFALKARMAGRGRHLRPRGGGDRVGTYRDLGSLQLLISLQDSATVRRFCDSVLAPIEAADARYGGELIRSLEVFIEEHGQWERASRRLFCHRHTLRYRIQRIEELTERDLERVEDRIEFWLAIRAREFIPGD